MIIERTGNIFTTKAQTIVNTINCVGIMGAGIAYEFRLRDKQMFEKYQALCKTKTIDIGILWIYSSENKKSRYEKILNFPTKYDWKFPSKEEYLHKGLQKFVDTYKQKGIESIAFPILGADKGGINPQRSLKIMESYLSKCDIDVEIWHFDPMAKDDLYEKFKATFNELDIETIKIESKIRIDKVKLVKSSLDRNDINSLSGLLRIQGIGETTIEKLFDYIQSQEANIHLFNYLEKQI
jgi:O-acetyl-ADP-ribose deacetylase (regulator of RNase III)